MTVEADDLATADGGEGDHSSSDKQRSGDDNAGRPAPLASPARAIAVIAPRPDRAKSPGRA